MRFLYLTLFAGLLSCKTLPPISDPVKQNDFSDSLWSIKIVGLNLSEDFSLLSTKNDELLLFIYPFEIDSINLQPPDLISRFTFDSLNKVHIYEGYPRKSLPETALFLLIEQDTGTSPDCIDSVYRRHHSEINRLFHKRDALSLEKFLGDDDILALKIIPAFNTTGNIQFYISGIFRADKYHYEVQIIRKEQNNK